MGSGEEKPGFGMDRPLDCSLLIRALRRLVGMVVQVHRACRRREA